MIEHVDPETGEVTMVQQVAPPSLGTVLESPTIDQIAAALAMAWGQVTAPQMNKEADLKFRDSPGKKFKYADLASIYDALRKPLSDNKLAIVQPIRELNGNLYLVTKLIHGSGQWLACVHPLTREGMSPQQFGSQLTYAKRYSIASLLCIAGEEDDDGAGSEDAMRREEETKKKRKERGEEADPAKAEMRKVFETIRNELRAAPSIKDLEEAWARNEKNLQSIKTASGAAYTMLEEAMAAVRNAFATKEKP